jgi:hypothetical protein
MSDFERVYEILPTLPEGKKNVVHMAIAQAMGYVWGWQDGGASPKDSDVAWNFAYAYGVHEAEFQAEKRSSRYPIRDAFTSWLAHGEIRDRYSVVQAVS